MKIVLVVGATNPIKIEAVRQAVMSLLKPHGEVDLEVVGFATNSKVPDTPYGEQIFEGARNRAEGCRVAVGEATYYVGLESGLANRYGYVFEEVWCYMIHSSGKAFVGYSSGLKVPDSVLLRMEQLKLEHCEVMDLLERERGLPISDTWSNYSGGLISRRVSFEEAVRNAFIQTLHVAGSLYRED